MKMHLNLSTRDLDASVAFYSTLLGAKPVKQLADYALFITEHPGLELALDADAAAVAASGHQTKVWASDLDGRRWETYVVHADTNDRNDAATCCA